MNWPRVSQLLGWAGAGLGLVGFLGWLLGIDILTRLHPDWVTMKANTALGLMASGAALALLRAGAARPTTRAVGRLLAGMVLLLGALTLAEILGGWDFGIDQAFFRESLESAGRSFPGRMGPASAAIFILVGLALLLLDAPAFLEVTPAQACAVAAMGFNFMVFLSYFYDVEVSAGLAPYVSIALHTVVAFSCICAGLLLARPERGFVAPFLSDETAGVVARRILPWVVIAPALLGWLFVLARKAGWYGRGMAVSLLAATLTVLFSALVWRSARVLGRSEEARREAERTSRRSERELADFFNNAGMALHSANAEGVILRANDAELALLGYSREEYVGRPVQDFYQAPEAAADLLARLHRGETVRDFAAQLRRRDGSMCEVLIDSSAYFEDGRFVHTRCFTRDVSDLRRTDGARAQLAAIVATSDDAIISKSLEGIVISWNAGAEGLFGYTAAEMIGQSLLRIIPEDRWDEERVILEGLRAGRRFEHFETVRRHKSGSEMHVSITVSPMFDGNRRIIGASKIARDITEQKRAEAELRQARDAAEAASRAKDDFLAALSHELRTPLTPVLMLSAELEKSAELPDPVRRDFAMIRRNIDLEARIIDDLLDLTRITRGKLTLRFEPVAVHGLIRHAVSILEGERAEKGIEVTLELDAIASWARADAVRLQQVVWNVLKNALKFTPTGGRVRVRSWNEEGVLRVSVADSGHGITAEEMPRIFDAFSQGDEAMSRFGGLGLGLSISALLVREHDGRIWAESAGRDQGATFHLELPLMRQAAPQPETADSTPGGEVRGSRTLRILLVEDHTDTREALVRLMDRWGHAAVAAASVAQARERLAGGADGFDLLVTDLGLPDGTGYDVVAAWQGYTAAPAVAMSGYGMEGDLSRSRSAGFAEHLIKPVSPRDLREVVQRVAGCGRPADGGRGADR